MYEFIEGRLESVSPTHVVLLTGGVGYLMLISLNAYEKLKDKKEARIWTHLAIKEDAHTLFGFAELSEREMFRQLIQVNGIGASTARMVLSSMSGSDLADAILSGNAALLKSVKGIGPKAAQRIIVELQDKVGKLNLSPGLFPEGSLQSAAVEEALEAMVALGFARAAAQKIVSKVSQDLGKDASVEAIIKNSLKLL